MRSGAVEDSLKSPASMSFIEISGERLGENAAVSKTVVHGNVYRGFESPLSASESQEWHVETRSTGPGFASFGRVRGQVGGKLDNNQRIETDEKTPYSAANRRSCDRII